ncbi:ABC transporter B family member 2 [Hordeum vulgare]|nr:ABC transporter B family member 2 [Hordeum vulgare]
MAKRRYITTFPVDDVEVAHEAAEEADYDDEVLAGIAEETDYDDEVVVGATETAREAVYDDEVAAERIREANYDDEVASEASGKSNDYEAVRQQFLVWFHIDVVGYDVELVHDDGLSCAISQVKWPNPHPSGSTHVDLMQGPTADLLCFALKNLPSFISMEALFSFLKDMFYDGGLASSAA